MKPGASIYMSSAKCAITTMSLGLTRPPLVLPSPAPTMLTLTSHYTATNAKHHRYAARVSRAGPARGGAELLTRGASMTTDGPGAGRGARASGARGRRPGRTPPGPGGDGSPWTTPGSPSILRHRNPSASDIHPRNRTRVGYVSLGTDDAIEGHRTGPGAIPRNKEDKDGC